MNKTNFIKSIYSYYFIVLSLLIAGLSGGFYYFWNNGAVNVSNISEVFEATAKLDSIKKKNEVQHIKVLVNNDKVRESLSSLKHLKKELNQINKTKKLPEFYDLSKSFSATERSINGLLSFTELSTILNVFSNKVNEFNKFTIENRWKTLTRMSNRIIAKVSPGKAKTKGFFRYKKIQSILGGVQKDIRLMKKVTEGSVLSEAKKSIILTKVIDLDTELKMIGNYLVKLKSFYGEYKLLEISYKNWIKVIEPAVSFTKIQFEKNSKRMLLGFGAMMVFILLSLIIGHSLHKMIQRKNTRNLEDFILSAVREGIIPYDTRWKNELSSKFQSDFDKLRDYIHQRMSFGTVFQEAIPFSSLLLDSNLNVVWANSLFYENWNLENYRGHNKLMTWDYLQRFTNLGEDDPVLLALNEQIAGIYQIQVRTDENGESLPYEMYVSPVEYGGQQRIMIFFYPLRSLEETIANQTKSIVGPIARSIEALSIGQFNVAFKNKIKSDFTIAGIENLYQKFNKFGDFITQQKMGMLNEVERLENELYDQLKLLDDLKIVFNDKNKLYNETVKRFDFVKKNIVTIVELRNEIDSIFNNTANFSKSLHQNEGKLIGQTEMAIEAIHENSKAFKSVALVRDDFKNLKNNFNNYRAKLSQVVEQSLVLQKTKDMTPQRMSKILENVRKESQNLEEEMEKFNKISRNLDVSLSKVQLIIEKSETINISEFKELFKKSKESLVNDIKMVGELNKVAVTRDDLLITSLRDLYTIFKESGTKLTLIDELIIHNRELANNGVARTKMNGVSTADM